MFYFLSILYFFLVLYIFLILRYYIGWHKLITQNNASSTPSVSIVIALRNEESLIPRLMDSISSLKYPIEKLEVILVNDHSTDETLTLLEKNVQNNIKILNMPKGKFGKKNAINMAVSIATGDIVLSSDADCIFNPYWVRDMCSYFINENVNLVSGPVTFKKQRGFFQSFQALEFISLIGSGAGAIGINNAIFCNGANMAFRRKVFSELNSFKNNRIVSGDDVFLLHSIKSKYPNSIMFANTTNAIVTTDSVQSFGGFINQRKRWVSKSSSYKDWSSIYVSYLVLFTNLSFFLLIVMLFFDIVFFKFFIFFYLGKLLIDLVFLKPVLTFFNRGDLFKWIFPFEFFYSFYIIFIVILSFTKNFIWKERIHKK